MWQKLLKAEGTTAIMVAAILMSATLVLTFGLPADLIAFIVRFGVAVCTVVYIWERFGEQLKSRLNMETTNGGPEDSLDERSGGEDQDRLQES